MNSIQLRRSFLDFFAERGHAVIPSAPLVPEHDPTVLFITAGMHPLVPYLLGEAHPQGRLLTDVQKCLRTDDIEEVGDATHNTFFEMLGFWSLGDYWKQDSLAWTLEWFTRVLGLERDRISVTVFAGDESAPCDEEAATVWRSLGIPPERIYYLPKEDNWWGPVGQTGPCGPDSELFYDTGLPACGPDCRPGCDCGKYVEIGNNVFLQYTRTAEATLEPLRQRNIDVGLGLERTLAMLNRADSMYETDLFAPIVSRLRQMRDLAPTKADLLPDEARRHERIVADHLRAATFLLADRVVPSNIEQGYVTRRLIRRAVRSGHALGIDCAFVDEVGRCVVDLYGPVYSEVERQRDEILSALAREEEQFRRTLSRGLREFEKAVRSLRAGGETHVSGETVFRLADTFGFPPSLTVELAREQELGVDMAEFEARYRQHQEQSRRASGQRFKGGLAYHSERTTQLHTATHLLQQALRDVLGEHVHQMGSNITPERLRFDFAHLHKLTPDEVRRVEELVNAQIARDLATQMEMMPLQQALDAGALAFFGERYGEVVKVYRIGGYSMEVCGGPHVAHTGGMGRFRILKAESIGHGTQRIRADLVPKEEG